MLKRTLASAILALAVVGCAPKGDDASFDQKVHAYLLQHPEVIQEAIDKGQQQKEAKAQADAQTAIASRKAALENDPRDFVANPNGKVTVVEFFDYRCPYCKAALPQLMDLIQQDKDVRFVFKEFPILDNEGVKGVSKRAALAAIAAKDHGSYLQIYNAMMGAKPLDDDGIIQALAANGIDANTALKDTPAIDKQLSDTMNLAVAIGVTGTPAFVVNGKRIDGADMQALAEAIQAGKKS